MSWVWRLTVKQVATAAVKTALTSISPLVLVLLVSGYVSTIGLVQAQSPSPADGVGLPGLVCPGDGAGHQRPRA